MTDFPGGAIPGALAFLFVQKLCDRLERNNQLPPGEARRVWCEIADDLKGDTRALMRDARSALFNLKLANE